MTDQHVLTWAVTESGGYETAWVTLSGTGLRARGRVLGLRPRPYWMTYELETGQGYVTRRLQVTAETPSATHRLDLRRDGGTWTADGKPLPEVAGALDCDLGLSPLTNAMPTLRHQLHTGPGRRDFLMAWVSVPDLTVRPSAQTYEHISLTARGARIRYTSGDFSSDIEFSRDGLVLTYPGIGHLLRAD
ncbi:putative glycolipid-binding domain-containing protein [Streptomyces sp. LX-29]|uniref:putative glycolipid-binding domain-containing protein n=1 Tax=Streptomyces sp. LX-29 TaxID=2900152 RepID=UPI00240E8DD1|nr:putative glycolipid-binding domain-containing protein [Streptomyces sp. LX-29]WFB11034.1 putative glycolipid-binding domain-containing protein [Streptomyces sp. LX-29]